MRHAEVGFVRFTKGIFKFQI